MLICGFSFHRAQCIWREIQDIGLAPAYKNDDATHKLCRKFLALTYLLHEHIQALFEKLAAKATAPMMAELVTYIHTNWIGKVRHSRVVRGSGGNDTGRVKVLIHCLYWQR